ncbi:GntR family transcriptional regulator, partial [bacterium]|nr:GntR family transcriptional regulator [bacterium]
MNKTGFNKNMSRRITVNEMAPHVHGFGYGENKVEKITVWLKKWIEESLKSGKILPYDFLPSKRDLAFHIGVSLGTMQNVFRNIEDCGLVESKQKIGTYVVDKSSKKDEKLTSKREMAVEKIKKHILETKYKSGDRLLSVRKLAEKYGMTAATVRNALNTLLLENILIKNRSGFVIKNLNFKAKEIQKLTLTEKTAAKIESLISKNNLKEGDKLPSNHELAGMFGASVKTVHDSLKILAKEGKILTKRGKYGTVVANPATHQEKYFYEQVMHKIKNYIVQNCQIGEKLPSIKEFSILFNVSTKTVKKALDEIEDEGYVAFSRG